MYICSVGAGLIDEAKIPVQELGGQRGEGAYFRENTIYYLSYVCVKLYASVIDDHSTDLLYFCRH